MNKQESLSRLGAVTFLGIMGIVGSVEAQMGPDLRDPDASPLTFSVGSSVGFDSLNYKDNSREVRVPVELPDGSIREVVVDEAVEDISSAYANAYVAMAYGKRSETTPWSVQSSFGASYYFDPPPNVDDVFYNGRLDFNIQHRFSERMSLSNHSYLSYESEPNFAIGASTARRTDQYLYGYNALFLDYAWSPRFSTRSGYIFSTILYQDDQLSGTSDRFDHAFRQSFSYMVASRTSAVGEYRLRYIDYRSIDGYDSLSHYALAGIDHAWSDKTTLTTRAGAEFRDTDRFGNQTSPYLEAALSYALGERTNLRWYNVFGLDNSELAGFEKQMSYRTGLVGSHQFTERFSGSSGVHFVYSDFSDPVAGGGEGYSENQFSASVGLQYLLFGSVNLNASYSFTVVDSGVELRDYTRHMASLGLSTSF
jgi:hypothetical protein